MAWAVALFDHELFRIRLKPNLDLEGENSMASRSMLSPILHPWPRSPLWTQLQTLQDEMNHVFDLWARDGNSPARQVPAFPPVNVWEDAEAVYIECELPGIDQKDLEIYVTGANQVTLKGQRKTTAPEKTVWHRQERDSRNFVRVLTLPTDVNRDQVQAHLENGILNVRLAKSETAKPRKIMVKAS
jgi:HSP20 family protein